MTPTEIHIYKIVISMIVISIGLVLVGKSKIISIIFGAILIIFGSITAIIEIFYN